MSAGNAAAQALSTRGLFQAVILARSAVLWGRAIPAGDAVAGVART